MNRYKLFITIIILTTLWFAQAFAGDVYHYKLRNGLNIYVKPDKRAPVVVSQVWYKVGSADEPRGLTGISHVLEHMMFEGTRDYPGNDFSKLIAENGGQDNAMTSQDFTLYFEKVSKDKLPLVFKLEADRMQNLQLTESAFKKEIAVVQEERRMRITTNPQALTYERLAAAAYIDNPYHHPIAGWESDLEHMKVSDARTWYENWYAPNNASLVVVGDVDPRNVYDLANEYFGKVEAHPIPSIRPFGEVSYLGKRTVTVNAPAKLPWLIMGYNVPSLKTAKEPWKAYALDVIAGILDQGDSSRIQRDLIRKSQVASSADVGYNLYSNYSGLFLFAGTPSHDASIRQLQQAFLNEINCLQSTPVSKAELTRVKNQVIAEQVFAKDSLSYQGMMIGQLETIGLSWKVEENYVNEIEKITPAQIQAVAKEYLIPERLTVGKLNPLPIKDDMQVTDAPLGDNNVH